MKILCVGEILVDMIGEGENLEKTETFNKKPGGAPANVAVAASRMGADVKMAATVGNDSFGRFLIDKLKDEKIGIENIRKSTDKTTLAFVSLDKEAKPDFSFYRRADTDIRPSQLDKGYDLVHIGSLPFTDEEVSKNIFNFLQKTDADISFDPNLREELMTDEYVSRIKQVLNYTDIVFLSEEEFENLDVSNVGEVVISKGEAGAEVKTGDKIIESRPPEVDVVDTTGAGDALTGTYLTFRDKGCKDALDLAVEAAAQSTTAKGAMSALPRKKELI